MQKLFIISNEAIYENNNVFFCDNKDLKSTPEGLENFFEVNLIARKTNIKRSHKINIKNIKVFSSLILFLREIIRSIKNENTNYLLISISPYTFFACIFLRLFKKKPVIYLRSNGFDEYKIILGYLGYIVYYFMFTISTNISTNISCREYILKNKKGFVLHPSLLNNKWLENKKKFNNSKKKLLYVGRIRKEKGIFSLINILKDKNDIQLTIVGKEENFNVNSYDNINFVKIINNETELINIFDEHKIFILPSFTEGQPMALLESLSRLRPAIIFSEIDHVIQNRAGIFISERNYESLKKTIKHIDDNYESIQELMKKNKLPTFNSFINNLSEIILKN